ncbi:hypothetical protein ACFLRF_04875 [Candidatus Altiarchaeota archaeon]
MAEAETKEQVLEQMMGYNQAFFELRMFQGIMRGMVGYRTAEKKQREREELKLITSSLQKLEKNL